MSDCYFTNFDITILGDAAPYLVHCTAGEHAAAGTFRFDIGTARWPEMLAALRDDRPGEATLTAVGSALFAELFQADVRDLWLRTRRALEQRTVDGIRLRLALQSPAVAALPWEYLYDDERNLLFGAQFNTPLVRLERSYRHVGSPRPPQNRLPLRLLLAAPEDPAGALDADAEIAALHAALRTVPATMLAITEIRGRFDMLDLRRILQEQRIDILHLITHGVSDGVHLWRGQAPYWAPASAIRATLQDAPAVRLVVLNACRAGGVASVLPFETVAQQLLQAGVPAVVAMQSEILDEDARTFAVHFYHALLSGRCPGAIDSAVASARGALYVLAPDAAAYGIPLLWLGAGEGQLFDRSEAAAAPAAQAETTVGYATGEKTPPPAMDGAEVEGWLTGLERQVEAAALQLASEHKFLLESWRRHAEELKDLLYQWRAIQQSDTASAELGRHKLDKIEQTRGELSALAAKIEQLASRNTSD